jgi:hypothetical protein
MAQRIEGPFDFSKYGFIKYADGATWILTKGEDYDVESETVLGNARKWARDEDLIIDYKKIEGSKRDPETIALRFRRKVRNIKAVGD